MQPKRKRPKKANLIKNNTARLDIGKVYKISTNMAGGNTAFLPAFFYFKGLKTNVSTNTVTARILRAGDTKAWEIEMSIEMLKSLSDYIEEVKHITKSKELTKILVRGI